MTEVLGIQSLHGVVGLSMGGMQASESYAMSVGKTWDLQRQADAMITHNIARDFGDEMKQAAAKIDTRLLIVVGEDDRVVTPRPALDIAELTGAAVLELDEDCGHGDPWCAPDAFATTVRSFLDND